MVEIWLLQVLIIIVHFKEDIKDYSQDYSKSFIPY